MKPTKRQSILLNFIQEFITKHGYSPSYREIKDGLDYNSIATVSLHIHSLIERGHLRNSFNRSRSLEVVGLDEQLLQKRVTAAYRKANQKDKQIIIHALEVMGFNDLAHQLNK